MEGRSVLLLGGGRWARVLVRVLRDVVPASTSILWVSQHGFASNEVWLKEQNFPNLHLSADEEAAWNEPLKAVVIATASTKHTSDLKRALTAGLPVLCEKPFSLNENDTASIFQLAQNAAAPAGMNLEFTFASYLQDFRQRLTGLSISTVDVYWQDPWEEVRHGEVKHPDVYTPLMLDQLLHAVSLTGQLLGKQNTQPQVSEVGHEVIVFAQNNGATVRYHLSRRAAERTRKIIINDGAALLDFAAEPGTSIVNDEKTEHSWPAEGRPLKQSLSTFWKHAESMDATGWPVSLGACQPFMEFCFEAQSFWEKLNKNKSQNLKHQAMWQEKNPESQQILINHVLPQLAEQGLRIPVFTPEERQAFAAKYLNSF